MAKQDGDVCGCDGCKGTLRSYDYISDVGTLEPKPYKALRCDTCRNVLLDVRELGQKQIDVWVIDWNGYETFRDFVERSRAGEGGPGNRDHNFS